MGRCFKSCSGIDGGHASEVQLEQHLLHTVHTSFHRAAKMAQPVRVLAALLEDPSSIPNTHKAAHNHPQLHSQRSGTLFWSQTPGWQVMLTQACIKHSYTENKIQLINKNRVSCHMGSGLGEGDKGLPSIRILLAYWSLYSLHSLQLLQTHSVVLLLQPRCCCGLC